MRVARTAMASAAAMSMAASEIRPVTAMITQNARPPAVVSGERIANRARQAAAAQAWMVARRSHGGGEAAGPRRGVRDP